MILQYDEYGRPVMISAADIQHTYTFSRAQGVWEDEAGQATVSDSLPVFTLERHPAPAALPLEIPPVHLSEAGAGIDRAALMSGAPSLTISPKTADIAVGEEFTLTVSAVGIDDLSMVNYDISDMTVVDVFKIDRKTLTMTFRGLSSGTAEITISCGKLRQTCAVTVK